MKENFKVAGIGELLWDMLPNGKQIGGAPFTFAYHSHQLGSESFLVSAVGNDLLGKEIVSRVKELGVSPDFVQVNAKPTSCVDIELDEHNNPSYIINENVAWDELVWDESINRFVGELDAVCFGSLAQRSSVSASTINRLLNQLKPECIKVFDTNLRQHYYTKEILHRSLNLADVLKINSHELEVLTYFFDLKGDILKRLYQIQDIFDLNVVTCTLGSKGSFLIDKANHSFKKSPDIRVVNTIGAGDAFIASLVNGLLHGMPLHEIHSNATKIAAFVCTQSDSNPDYLLKELE